MRKGWVYILCGRTGTLYTGVTSNLYKRVFEHRNGINSGFASKYDCNRLVYFEEFGDITTAIDREKKIQGLDARKEDCFDRIDESRMARFGWTLGQTNVDAEPEHAGRKRTAEEAHSASYGFFLPLVVRMTP